MSKLDHNSLDVNNKIAVFMRLGAYLKSYWWAGVLTIIGFAIGAAAEAGSVKLFQYIIDAINADDQVRKFWFPFLVIALFVVRGIGAFLGGYYSSLMARSLVYQLRIEVFNKLLRLPSSFYLNTPSGVISSKLIFDVEQVTAASIESITTLIKDGLIIVVLFGYLFYINWRLTLVLMVVVPPIFWLIRRVSKKFADLSLMLANTVIFILFLRFSCEALSNRRASYS